MKIDLICWKTHSNIHVTWEYGRVGYLPQNWKIASIFIDNWLKDSQSDFVLFWTTKRSLPNKKILNNLIMQGIDVAHCGLLQGLGENLADLSLLGTSWDKLNSSVTVASSSWRLGLDACLVRRELFLELGGLDTVFDSAIGTGLEFGYRCLKLGALIEYRPELCNSRMILQPWSEPPVRDFYCFVLRHYGLRWSQYVLARRMLSGLNYMKEWRAWQSARRACQQVLPTWSCERPWQPTISPVVLNTGQDDVRVSVILPTLGRYSYLPGALNSLLSQTVRPFEVIVVDQNSPETRQPDVYHGYEGINLKVIWQDERGQSLARNIGLAAAQGDYVFLFDDDSIAMPDLIERHLAPVLSGRFSISTGVAIPPPPAPYTLPPEFRYPRLAQTFDTGNALLALGLARQMGGLDRNYDFGPGTDADFGTRLYLAGYRILHNPLAVRIHFKASTGGLRVHGAKKYNTDDGLFHPYPPITQSYYALRYLNPKQAREVVFLGFLLNKFPKDLRQRRQFLLKKMWAASQFIVGLSFISIKRWRSIRQARKLLQKGIRLMHFDESDVIYRSL